MDHYGGSNMSYDRLRGAVREAWDAITPQELDDLVDGMRELCQAVIDTEGKYTRFYLNQWQ